jgi:N-acetylmuramic acid 6-phosphate etherase
VLPQTEKAEQAELTIDRLDGAESLARMLDGQRAALESVRPALPSIEAGAALVAATLRGSGRLVYAAAGSSGLMALADGAELPGTFGIPQERIVIRMAGGVPVDGAMPGETEDDAAAAEDAASALGASDLVIALSASGTTPYPLAIARVARQRSSRVIAICNNSGTPLLAEADVAICLETPPEVLAGSTRL